MVSQEERARLIASWRNEPLYVVGRVFKSGACLLILCGLAYIGAMSDPSTERTAQTSPSHQGRITPTKVLDTVDRVREAAQPATRTADHTDHTTVTRPVAFDDTSCQGPC
jgi:hypothetical protein